MSPLGLIAGEDGVCEPCRRGDSVNCQNPVVSGVTVDSGYAEVMIAEARGVVAILRPRDQAEDIRRLRLAGHAWICLYHWLLTRWVLMLEAWSLLR